MCSVEEHLHSFRPEIFIELFGDSTDAFDHQRNGFGGVWDLSRMVGQQFKENADYILAVAIFEDSEHDSIHSFDKVISSVFYVSGPEFFIYLSFMLILINKLTQSEVSAIAEKLPNIFHHVRTFDTALK
jgi:hypothetical protein